MIRREFVTGTAAAVGCMATGLVRSAEDRSEEPESVTPLRVVQVGAQGHYGDIVTGIPLVKDCRLVGVARSFPAESVENITKSLAWSPAVPIYDDYRKMLDELEPDIVAVFAPYASNGQVNIEAVRHGCHVISEKPVASTLNDLDTLRAERDRMKVRVAAMLTMRSQPGFVAAHKAVRAGCIGEPLLISAQKSYKWGGRPWYFKLRKDYGGSIPWVAIHAIDFIRFVTGLEFTSVTARQVVKLHKEYPQCEDCGALLFEMSNGGHATLTFDYLRPAPAGSHGDDRLRVAGTRGVVEVRVAEQTFCELISDERAATQLPLAADKHNIFVDFVASLRGGHPLGFSDEDVFRATEVALKARDAADRRLTVEL
jgi:predicted dehydrogenase